MVDTRDQASVYMRADMAPLLIDTAQAFNGDMLPAVTVPMDSTRSPDPLFPPADAGAG